MKKIEKREILLILGIAISASIMIFQIPLAAGDEIWNFQNIYKMVNGYQIYTDANVIITPIFFWIGFALFKVLGANILIFRLFDIFVYTILVLLVYKILKQLKIETTKAVLFTLIFHYFSYDLVTGGASYNTLAVLFVLIGTYFSLKEMVSNKFIILNGILMYLIFFTKQNIGAYYVIATIFLQIMINGNNKQTIFNIIKQLGIAFVLSMGTLGILYIQGVFWDFINIAFLGIGEFGSQNTILDPICIAHILICTITIISAIIIRNHVGQEENKNIKILLGIGIPMLLIIYPIINVAHTMLAMAILLILLLYLTYLMINQFLTPKIVNGVTMILTISIMALCLSPISRMLTYEWVIKDYHHPYYGLSVSTPMLQHIEKVNEYIDKHEGKVIMLSDKAAIYNIPEKRNNGKLDLIFLGNLGYQGEEKLIEEVSNMKNTQILMYEPLFWQESEKLLNYLKEHYEVVGKIEEYDIYQIP